MMTFKDYIAKRRVTRNPTGDFIRDARTDPYLPNVTSLTQLNLYLWNQGACPEARAAASVVWRSYLRSKRNAA